MLISATTVPAHHSAASAYDTAKKITMKGTVTKVEWKNPHVFYYLDVADAPAPSPTGRSKASTPNQLYRNGWRKDDLKIGDAVTVVNSSPARNGSKKAYGGTLTLADGRKRLQRIRRDRPVKLTARCAGEAAASAHSR